MNILDEITVDFDLDSKILCDTPAKLKLRDKTLKGIRFNLDDEDSTLPALMLAKKNKMNNKEYTGVNISDMDRVETDSKYDLTRKLNVSKDNQEIFSKIGKELVNMISAAADLTVNMDEVKQEPEVNVVTVEEIPETDVNVIDTYSTEESNEIVPEVVIEEPEYNVEQGDEGVVASVEAVEVPVIQEEVSNEIPNVQETVTNETALDKANNVDAFKEATLLKEEIDKLKVNEQEKLKILAEKRESYQNEIDRGIELDKTYAQRKQRADEKEREFYEAVERKKKYLYDMKKGYQERDKENEQGIIDFTNKRAAVYEANEVKVGQIQEEDDRFDKFQNLIDAFQPLENGYEEESTYKKVA